MPSNGAGEKETSLFKLMVVLSPKGRTWKKVVMLDLMKCKEFILRWDKKQRVVMV